ncbi:DegV family protein [Microlunatus ginsengisoli]|uniref:DegV family protein n=1 Tax=Microlunatus ginsengisoli TaxID=363863 RepID=UPI0031D40BBB
MAGVAMVTDSTSSLRPTDAQRDDIVIVPLQVVIDGVSRTEHFGAEGATSAAVTPGEVARALREGRRVTTSRPGPDAFVGVYRRLAEDGYDAVVSAHLSRAVSGTVDAAAVAAPDAPIPVTVVDSGTVAMATGFAVLAGAVAAKAGADAEEVARTVERRAAASTTYFCVADLEHLRRGGRIGAAAALVGSALAVKPLLTVENGTIQPYERVRTTARAHARLAELATAAMARAAAEHPGVDVAVHHFDDLAAAERLADQLRDRVSVPRGVVIAELSAVLGVHVGPGTLGVVVTPRS